MTANTAGISTRRSNLRKDSYQTNPSRPLRDKPDLLQRSMKDVLCDLHHLADAGEIKWTEILGAGERSYREKLRGGG